MPLWNGPTADFAMQPDEFLRSALDQPMSLGSTFFDQATGGVMESFGLGTAIREGMTPDTVDTPKTGETEQDFFRRQMQARGPSSIGQAVGAAAGQLQAALSEDQFKASPYYREGIPYDRGMTSARAQALAEMYDIKKAREFYADKRPITSFIGNILGQATDPINYVPVFGPAARAAAVTRFGTVGGRILVAGADAAANTAIAGVATTEARNRFGDQIDWEDTVSQSAMAALIGGAFGAVGGVLARRAEGKAEALRREAELRLATLERTQEARAALNDAVQSLAIDGEVRLSKGTRDAVQRTADEIAQTARLDTLEAKYLDELNTVYGRQDVTDGQSLFGAIKARGGLRLIDREGEDAAAVLQDARFPPGMINNKSGRNADDLVLALWEDGYFGTRPDRPSLNEFYDLLREEAAGTKVFTEAAGIERADIDARRQSLEMMMAEAGVPATRSRKQMARALAKFDLERDGAKTQEMRAARSQEVDPDQWWFDEENINDLRSRGFDDFEPIPFFGNEAPPMDATPPKATGADPKAIAEQYGVNAETGEFVEQAEVDALKAEGRMTEDEVAALADADKAVQIGASWGEALKAAVGCLI